MTAATPKPWRHWLAIVAIAAVYALVATRNIALPGIYADAINPDYLVTRTLNPDPARSIVWILYGNSLLGDRAPVLISLYHGSQHFWLGLPLYALFGTSVEGVRLVHATFALGVLLAMYLLVQRKASAWIAALASVALAVDPSFSFSFRTQAYITVAPAAWLFLGLWCLLRACDAQGRTASRWLLASGALCGLAAVGYFVWAFFLPPVIVAVVRWTRGLDLPRPGWRTWGIGLLLGAFAYPLGYLLMLRKAGGIEGIVALYRELSSRVDPFRSAQDMPERIATIGRTLVSVLDGSWHSAMMFNGDALTVPGAHWKIAILVAVTLVLWVAAELQRTATPLQRLFVALPLSFAACSLAFGGRLGGHHYSTLVPILYAGMATGAAAWLRGRGAIGFAAALPFAMLILLSSLAQREFGDKLVATGGKGLLSDAIHRLASDLERTNPKPLLWFPDAVLALPLIILTHGDVEMSDQIDDVAPGRRLCAGQDVWMVRIPNHASTPRGEAWLARLDWPTAPRVEVYRERTGAPVFEVLRFKGDAGACKAPERGTGS